MKYHVAGGKDLQDGHEEREAKPISAAHSKPPNTTSLSVSSPYHIHRCWREVETAPCSD